jgi:hypothetical protein
MTSPLLKLLLLVSSGLLFSFGAFYLLIRLCLNFGIHPSIGVLVFLWMYAVFLYREYRRVS